MHDPVEQPSQCENPPNDVESVQTGHEIVDAEKDPQVASRIDGINLFLVDHDIVPPMIIPSVGMILMVSFCIRVTLRIDGMGNLGLP